MVLPKFLLDFLEKNNYAYKELLQYNHRKETYILKIEYHNSFYLLKAYDKDKTPKEIQEKFLIEKEFYVKNKELESIPKLIDFYENILILEYFNSISLRDYLIQSSDKQYLLEALVEAIDNFDKKIDRKKDNRVSYDNIYRYISSLCNSHPIQAKDIKISFLDSQLNRIINKLLILKSKKIVNLSCCKNLIDGLSHNDFHYNNILITSDNRVKFIDFENVKDNGFFEFDILALIVMVEVYIDKKNDQEVINRYLKKLFQQNEILEEIYNIYQVAISINKKFYIQSNKKYLTKIEKSWLIMNLLINKGKISNV